MSKIVSSSASGSALTTLSMAVRRDCRAEFCPQLHSVSLLLGRVVSNVHLAMIDLLRGGLAQARVSRLSTPSADGQQATGEDWKGVKLFLSTARPSLGAEIPLLSSDKLRSRPKTDEENHSIEVTSRDEEIAETGPAPVHLSETPPGLDDGGEARTFTTEGRIDLPGDGRPHQVEIERWSTTPKLDQLCYPERATFVFLKSTQQSASTLPLLAGPVDLVRGGGFVGRSEITYVAPKANFQLSWGSEDGIVVLRELDHKLHKTKIRKRREHDFSVEVYLANHTGEAQKLELIERVPVSEIEQVKVQVDEKTSPGYEVDDQGLVHWQVQMAPDEELSRQLVFKVMTPSNVKWRP